MMYKFSLDKTSKKYYCPRCNKKRFVKYVDNMSGNYLEDKFGRCDRESNCQYHLRPDGNQTNCLPTTVLIAATSYHHYKLIDHFMRNNIDNNFIIFLKVHFSLIEVEEAIRKYSLGTSPHWKGANIFWQIDENDRVRAGKIMLYNKSTGKRIKEPYPHITWMHKSLDLNNFNLKQCLFGLHNLKDYEAGSVVCIVESEKTAVIMSIVCPQHLWLATGSKSNFKLSMLKPLKNYLIIVFPDKSEYESWKKVIVNSFSNEYNISISTYLENLNVQPGTDIVDIFIL